MINGYSANKIAVAVLAGAVLLLGHSTAQGVAPGSAGNAAALNLKRLSGTFTVTSFQVVNGVSQASGLLTADATDTAGQSLNMFTNVPVKLPFPLNGALAGKASLLASLSKDYVQPPELSSNLCTILGVSVEFIHLAVPLLGLDVHVNELALVVRADRETRLGDVLCTLIGTGAYQDIQSPDIRSVAKQVGVDALSTLPVPEPPELGQVLNPGPAARTAAIRLGKSLFWDMQVGSDGMACASCHSHAGADNRTRNQLNPGILNSNIAIRGVFNDTPRSGVTGGPDYTLTPQDFPLHQLADATNRIFGQRVVTFDTDDVVSSMGVFARNFTAVAHPLLDDGVPYVDPIFNLDGPLATQVSNNVRRVEPRNAPSVINAVFNHANFWDGRAHPIFNGATPIGPLDTNATIWVNNGTAGASPVQQFVRISNASLASQAVAPPTRNIEMSFFSRKFHFIGVKLLRLGFRPLGQQIVHASDSVLGPLSLYPEKGLNTYYTNLIQEAFLPKYWNGTNVNIEDEFFTQMEANFNFFFGLAIQLYESTLVSDQTPFDRFMAGDNSALTEEQLRGMLAFLNQGTTRNPPSVNRLIADSGVQIGVGNCVSCHAGPEFTAASYTHLRKGDKLDLLGLVETPLLANGVLGLGGDAGVLDTGFSNIGIRPTIEDLGRGGTADNGLPLSFVRQALDPALKFLLPSYMQPYTNYPGKLQVDGAFKIPGLRNVELTGPYFHNGGQATLAQVIEYYHRQGDFGNINLPFLDQNLAFISLAQYDHDPLVKFLLALTDERVRQEQAPFDHPQILLPDGGTFGIERPFVEIPAVGAGGRPAAGLPPLGTFLGLSPLGR